MSIAVIDGPSLQEVHLDEDARALLVGGASDLPGSSRELEEVRKLFPQGAFWRLDGDLSQLQSELSRSRLLHISTHASIPTPRSLSGTLRGDGSATSAFQLSELVFPAGSLAVVAACQSAVDAGTGRDNTSLVSALRTAGADAVVGSLWELDDEATAALVGHFYERVRQGDAPDVALASAQRETARKWPHPFYWAGLQVVTGP